MGLSSGFYTSVSGLNACGTGLSVLGNNIANLNTVGFKGSRSLFGDIFTAALKDDASSQIGGGVNFKTVDTQFIQGTIAPSTNPFDFAIEGSGFFVMRDAVSDAEYFTRAGMFSLNKESYFVNPDGLRLRGYMADAAGNILPTLTDLQIPRDANNETIMPPRATTTASLRVNLNAADAVPDPVGDGGSPALDWAALFTSLRGPAPGSYNYSTSITVFDGYFARDPITNQVLVNPPHTVDIHFVKTANYAWDVYAVWDSAKPPASGPHTPNFQYQLLGGITFGIDPVTGNDGQLLTQTLAPINLTWDPAWNAPAATVTLDLNNSTQYGSPHSVAFQQSDGYTAGGLTDFRMGQDGVLYGLYSNAQERAMAQLVIAKFNAPQELEKKGENLYAQTAGSGDWREAIIGPGEEVRVFSQSLEMSNVDLASEFVNMIALQRAFQANATTMRTTNEMLVKLTEI